MEAKLVEQTSTCLIEAAHIEFDEGGVTRLLMRAEELAKDYGWVEDEEDGAMGGGDGD